MQIKEVDCRVLFYCEDKEDIDVLSEGMRKVEVYRERLI